MIRAKKRIAKYRIALKTSTWCTRVGVRSDDQTEREVKTDRYIYIINTVHNTVC